MYASRTSVKSAARGISTKERRMRRKGGHFDCFSACNFSSSDPSNSGVSDTTRRGANRIHIHTDICASNFIGNLGNCRLATATRISEIPPQMTAEKNQAVKHAFKRLIK